MNRSLDFTPYPLAPAPVYSRWVAGGIGLAVLLGGGGVLLRPMIEPRLALAGAIGALLIWALAFLVRVLCYRFNRHTAQCYAEATAQEQQRWWAHHRKKAALVESVLVSAVCSKPEHLQRLLSAEHQPPVVTKTREGEAIRMLQVFAEETQARERELAVLLALQWQAQRNRDSDVQPLRCFWQGSITAWRAFADEMAKGCAPVRLPDQPEPWQGIETMSAIIDQLHEAPADALVLCAGCQASPTVRESRLPAGEAAVLWLLGSSGGVRLSRGEWFAAQTEDLAAVASRTLQQSELETPAQGCMSFSQADLPDLASIGWNTRQNLQDANFGALANLEAMVAQTLAAWYAEQQGVPCAWLASDPHHTLTLGVVEPDDSRS